MKHQNISVTGSLNLNGVGVATTANLNAYTASSNSKVDALIAQTGSYATTGSNTFTGAQVVQGTLTAQTLVVQTVTSSVLFSTGSNKLGSSLSNVQELTGSVGITGSLAINGTTAVVGSGTANYVPKFTAGSTVGNSLIFDNGTNVGIGTTSPNSFGGGYRTLAVAGTGTEGGIIQSTVGSTSALYIGTNSSQCFFAEPRNVFMTFGTNDTERMRIDSAGNLGLGVVPFTNTLSKSFDLVGGGGMFSVGSSFYIMSNAYYNTEWRYKATSGANGIALNSDGSITFSNAASGTINTAIPFTTKMTITSGGSVLIGTTTDRAVLTVEAGTGSSSKPTLSIRHGAVGFDYANLAGAGDQYHGIIFRGVPAAATDYSVTPGDQMSFYEYGGEFRFYQKTIAGTLSNQVKFVTGTIYASNTTVQSISDIRTKENITNSEQGLNVIDALRPVRFDFKEEFNEGKKNQLGFIAQEVEEIFPDAVGEWKDDNDGITYKTVGPGALIPILVKAIQELSSKNTALEEILQRNNIQ